MSPSDSRILLCEQKTESEWNRVLVLYTPVSYYSYKSNDSPESIQNSRI